MTPKKLALICGGLVLLIVLLVYFDGSKPSAELSALKADPLASYVPAESKLLDTDAENEGSTFGKPSRARYSRMFAVPAADPEAQLEAATEAARAAGWEITATDTNPGSLGALVTIGDKRLENGRAQMAITVFVDDTLLRGEIKSPALKVTLEHLGPS